MSEENPYERQTTANTGTGWLTDDEPLDVDIDGLVDYASNAEILSNNVMDNMPYLQPLMEIPNEAWEGPVLGEAAVMRSMLFNNTREFMQYLVFLRQALYNVGSAAQTVADIYRSSDGTSAATLDDVRWAFGDHRVARPSGLPDLIGRTWLQEYLLQRSQDPEALDVPAPAQWHDSGTHRDLLGREVQTSTNEAGEVRTITTWHVGDTKYVQTRGPDGTVILSRTTQVPAPSGMSIETTETRTDGVLTGRTTVSSGNGWHTTSHYDVAGNLSSQTTRVHNANGSVTETDTSYDEHGNPTVTSEVTTGAGTYSADPSDNPGMEAIEDLREHGYR